MLKEAMPISIKSPGTRLAPITRSFTAVSMLKTPISVDKVKAEFEASDAFRIEPYGIEEFYKYWATHVGISPQKLARFLTKDLEEYDTHIFLELSPASHELNLTLTANVQGDNTPYKTLAIKIARVFELQNGIMSGGFIISKTNDKTLAKPLLRKIYELGYELNCPRIQAEATQKGCYLWLPLFDIDEVNPIYQERMLTRLDKMAARMPEDLYKHAKEAIQRGDLKAIAAMTEEAPFDLSNTAYMGLYAETMYQDSPPPITIGKVILMDHMMNCWIGHMDLTNPEHCARIDQHLSQWEHPGLRMITDSYLASNGPTPKNDNTTTNNQFKALG